MSEAADLTNKIIDFLYRQGVYSWRNSSVGVFDKKLGGYRTAPKKGVADILACVPPTGRLVAIEIKIGKDRLSPEQEGFLVNISHVGGLSVVIKTYDEFLVWYAANIPLKVNT